MSESSARGKAFEITVQKMTSKKLHLEAKRDSRSGAGLHKQDVRDRYNLLPLFIECKDQESLSVKKEWRIANDKASAGQAPVVVFPDDGGEILCVMRYSDMLNFIREAMDWKETADDLSAPVENFHQVSDTLMIHNGVDTLKKFEGVTVMVSGGEKPMSKKTVEALSEVAKVVVEQSKRGDRTCRNGHLVDDWGYCMQKGCKYSHGYRPPKVKKK